MTILPVPMVISMPFPVDNNPRSTIQYQIPPCIGKVEKDFHKFMKEMTKNMGSGSVGFAIPPKLLGCM